MPGERGNLRAVLPSDKGEPAVPVAHSLRNSI
jgi:hypothetical protein